LISKTYNSYYVVAMELLLVPVATKRNWIKQVVAKVGIEDEDNVDSGSSFEEELEG
jgi:hypothetical protein